MTSATVKPSIHLVELSKCESRIESFRPTVLYQRFPIHIKMNITLHRFLMVEKEEEGLLLKNLGFVSNCERVHNCNDQSYLLKTVFVTGKGTDGNLREIWFERLRYKRQFEIDARVAEQIKRNEWRVICYRESSQTPL